MTLSVAFIINICVTIVVVQSLYTMFHTEHYNVLSRNIEANDASMLQTFDDRPGLE